MRHITVLYANAIACGPWAGVQRCTVEFSVFFNAQVVFFFGIRLPAAFGSSSIAWMHGPTRARPRSVEDRDTSEGNLPAPPRFYASSPFFLVSLPSYTSNRVNATIQPSKDASGCPSTRLPMMTLRGREVKLPPARE